MIDHSPSSRKGLSGPVLFITVVEGPDVLPEVAFLAGALRASGIEAVRFPADFCSDERVFEARLEELRPRAVWFHYTTEWREMVARGAEVARAISGAPVYFVGSAVEACRGGHLPVPRVDGVETPSSLLEEDLVGLVGGASIDANSLVPDWTFFGPGLENKPVSTSLFARWRSIGMVAGREAPQERSPSALLARLAAPRLDGPRNLRPDVIEQCVSRCAGFERIEWWDRTFDRGKLPLLAIAEQCGLRQSVRLLPADAGDEHLAALRRAGVDEVVLETDRVSGLPPLPGSAATLEEIGPIVDRMRAADLEASLLFVLGLPEETRDMARRRIDGARALGFRHVRCIPFEPTGGHPAFDRVAGAGLLPSEEGRWKREVHRPLKQRALSTEEFVDVWSEAMLLHAEVESNSGSPRP